MSISKFKGQFADLLRPNYYEIIISPPAKLNAQAEILSYLCSSTDFPFETIQILELVTHSRKRMIASGVDFDPITTTFLLDSTGKVLDLFQKWKALIIDDTFRVGYYEDYIGTMEIYMLDRQMQRVFGVKLKEVYPVNRGNIALSQSSVDTVSEISISFVYAQSEYNMNNVLYPSATQNWDSVKRKYSGSFNPFDINVSQVNDYLGKFGSDLKIPDIGKTINKLISPFSKQLNGLGLNNKVNELTSKFKSKYSNIFTSNISKITSPIKKYTSGITKTINKIFKF